MDSYLGLAGISAVAVLVYLAIIAFYIACYWIVFEKAGQPGWAAIIPFYNLYIILKIGGKPGWWILLLFVPFANIVIEILMYYYFLKAFRRHGAEVLLMLFLNIFYLPYLAFSQNVKYVGPIE